MDEILQFLKDKYQAYTELPSEITVNTQDLEKINRLFGSDSLISAGKHLKLTPRIAKSQIWSIKQEYIDFMGEHLKCEHPILVRINREYDEIDEETFVRVHILSPFLDYATQNDIICQDSSIIGFPFLIEFWNDQPLLAELLEEYIGYYDNESKYIEDKILSTAQKEFREIEISRARYLNNSVTALLTYLENRQMQNIGASISYLNSTVFPKLNTEVEPKEPNLSLAAKSGIDSSDTYIHYKTETIPFDIYIRKNDNGFIVTILPQTHIKLCNSSNQEIPGTSNDEKIVFHNLGKGLYSLYSKTIKQPVRIRLK